MNCKIITLETPREVEIARHHWHKGWNEMLKVLPKVLRDSVLLSRDEALAEALARLEAKQLQPELAEIQRKQLEERYADEKYVPWNREYTEEKKPLVHYYHEGIMKYWNHPVQVAHAAKYMVRPLVPSEGWVKPVRKQTTLDKLIKAVFGK